MTTEAAPPAPRVWLRAVLPAGYGAAGLLVLVAVLVGLNVGGWRERLLGRTSAPRLGSLAVLPLNNLSRDPEQEYFADGMTDELITELGKIGLLKVISRTSVTHFKASSKTVPEIARELNVDAVLQGSVLRSGQQVRITVQLTDATTDRNLWGQSYERNLRDVLALQDEVAAAIAQQIQIKLTAQQQTLLGGARTVDPAAHEAYLKGRYYWNKRTDANLKKSIDYFQQAIEKDPGYAQAYAELADCYIVLPNYSTTSPQDAYPKAKAAAEKAIQLDDTLAEAYAPLTQATPYYSYDWLSAERAFKRATELSPNYATAHQWYASMLARMGNTIERSQK